MSTLYDTIILGYKGNISKKFTNEVNRMLNFFSKVTLLTALLLTSTLSIGYIEVAVHNPITGSDSIIQLLK